MSENTDASPGRGDDQKNDFDRLAELDGVESVEVECAVGLDAVDSCDGWCETIKLDEPAIYERERIYLPGFNWECPECGNPHEFEVEGIRVSNLV